MCAGGVQGFFCSSVRLRNSSSVWIWSLMGELPVSRCLMDRWFTPESSASALLESLRFFRAARSSFGRLVMFLLLGSGYRVLVLGFW